MSGPRPRPILNAALCVLLLAGSTATTVRHSHEHGGVPHAHGFGFLPASAEPAAPPGPRPAAHDHLIVFGFEVYEGELPVPGEPNPAPVDAGVSVGLGGDAVVDDGRPAAVLDTADAPLPPPANALPAVAAPGRAVPSRRSSPPGRCSVCDRARGERSGVGLV